MVYLQSKLNKKTLLGGALFLIVLFFFTSCENFLKADEISQQIQAAIDYNNAPAYTIKLNSEKGSGVIRAPSGNETLKKVTDVFNISFDADDNYEFIEWKIKDISSNTELANGDYLEIDFIDKDSANCTFKKAPDAGMQLCIIPVVARRPRIIDNYPKEYNVYRDAGILVMFDNVMDDNSIHYTKGEITELKRLYNLSNSDFLPPIEDFIPSLENENEPTNCYGYKKGNEKVYKVVEITDYNKNTSLLDKFGEPSFGDPKTLVIPIGKVNDKYTLLDNGTQVLVTLRNTISYLYKNKKSVSLKDDEPWVYYVGSKEDTTDPVVDSASTVKACDIVVNESNPSQDIEQSVVLATSSSEAKLIYNRSLDFNIMVSDDGTGTAPYFIMKFKDPSGKSQEEKIFYNTVTSAKARSYIGKYTIPEKYGDGTYQITEFVFYDNKNRTTTPSDFKNKYFKIDSSAPSVNYSLELADSSADSSKFTLTYTSTDSSNTVRKGKIQYREYNSSQNQDESWENIQEQDIYTSPYVIDGLQNNKKYEFKIQFINKLGNSATEYVTKYSRPNQIKNLTPSIVRNTTASVKDVLNLTWQNPDEAFNGVFVELVDASNNTIITSKGVNTNNCKFENLDFSKSVKARISVYKEDSGKKIYSIPCESEVIYTKPQEELYKGHNSYALNTTNSVGIQFEKNNGITNYKIQYKLKSAANSQYIDAPDATNTNNASTFYYYVTGLQSGYEYSIQITPYFHDAPGTPYSISGFTKPPAIKEETVKIQTMDGKDSNYIKVSWEKPLEDCITGYKIFLFKGTKTIAAVSIGNTRTEYTFDNKCTYNGENITIEYLSEYKIRLIADSNGYGSDKTDITFTSAPKNVHMTRQSGGIKFDNDIYSSYSPYNNEGTKIYLCYGSTVEEALQGSYYYEITLSQKQFIFTDSVCEKILNDINSVDCYFVVKTVPATVLDSFDGPYYSDSYFASFPPRPATSYGDDYCGQSWSSSHESDSYVPYWYYYNAQTVTLKWKNPTQCDSVKIYYAPDDDKNTWVFAKSITSPQEYAEVTINPQYKDIYDVNEENFVIIPVYKGVESKYSWPLLISIKLINSFSNLNLQAVKEVVDGENKIKLTWQKPTGITFDRYNIEYIKKTATNPVNFDKDSLTIVNGKIKYREVSYNNYEYVSGGVNKNETSVYTQALEPGTYLFKFSIVKDVKWYYEELYVNYIEVTIP